MKEMNIVEATKYIEEHPEAEFKSSVNYGGKPVILKQKGVITDIHLYSYDKMTLIFTRDDIFATYTLIEPEKKLKYTHAELMDRTKWWRIKGFDDIYYLDNFSRGLYLFKRGSGYKNIEWCSENLTPYNPEEEA